MHISRVVAWIALASSAVAQTITPSNNSQDLYPISTSPRFLLKNSDIPNFPSTPLAPLGDYARMSHSDFTTVRIDGHLTHVDASNVTTVGGPGDNTDIFSYISCDPDAYTGNLDASDVFRIAVNQPHTNIVILYSQTADHCAAQGLDNLPAINGILTVTGPKAATSLKDDNATNTNDVVLVPDMSAYTNATNENSWSNGWGQSPTTAVAMIILYSITGIITALFVVIIVTGAIRAHRHPERYGPRNIAGRGRQSRAKGIARAMLETLPIVKFGDKDAQTKDPTRTDIEMNPSTQTQPVPAPATAEGDREVEAGAADDHASANNADGTDEQGQLGCSICTEDFTKGEDIRVLPCNHKFHPDCVDPWLLNVSGTCPLCRIDLRPQDAEGAPAANITEGDELPPPLAGSRNDMAASSSQQNASLGNLRRDTFAQLRNMAAGSHEDRLAALRRYRQEHRANQTAQDEGERRGVARRLRERFRVRTERRGSVMGVEDGQPDRRRRSSVGRGFEVDRSRRGTFAGPSW